MCSMKRGTIQHPYFSDVCGKFDVAGSRSVPTLVFVSFTIEAVCRADISS